MKALITPSLPQNDFVALKAFSVPMHMVWKREEENPDMSYTAQWVQHLPPSLEFIRINPIPSEIKEYSVVNYLQQLGVLKKHHVPAMQFLDFQARSEMAKTIKEELAAAGIELVEAGVTLMSFDDMVHR
jgi:hypothetical protein